ncbi:hypothetical protein BO86DRAFT_376362 [Aspergillus japonicus CBS 114.51]|uniref:Uncharacterized protein n=1 Tax=Aspergillus japonicus CBS 114.51 TaxID=1448312 RepID=A0A8T8XD76_ASPJA|nr:hypothetical protein BO86DRAFT_376362 [Aspergillus japonicus CBS 114.51]RAH85352.1 hypothetical protein BO86DRAFT_376362 [Aspergillus japonicus CBS 114.51]
MPVDYGSPEAVTVPSEPPEEPAAAKETTTAADAPTLTTAAIMLSPNLTPASTTPTGNHPGPSVAPASSTPLAKPTVTNPVPIIDLNWVRQRSSRAVQPAQEYHGGQSSP